MSDSPTRKSIMEAREQLREKYENNLRFIEQLLKEKGELRDTVIDRLGEIESQMMHLEAENGEELLEIADKTTPALIIADYMMPKIDGLKCRETILTIPNLADVPFVLCTAVDSDEVKKQSNILRITSIVRAAMHAQHAALRQVIVHCSEDTLLDLP